MAKLLPSYILYIRKYFCKIYSNLIVEGKKEGDRDGRIYYRNRIRCAV